MLDQILTFLTRRRKPSLRAGGEDALRNYALELAQEWGEQWLQPIQQRLAKALPHLSPEELDNYNAVAQAAMMDGYNLVYTMAEQNRKQIKEPEWRSAYLDKYPWVDRRNLAHLFSTGMYYAYKDGLV